MSARARSTVVVSIALALSACSIDLSGLQRKDGGLSPATDPDAAMGDTSESNAGAGEAGTLGSGGAGAGVGGDGAGVSGGGGGFGANAAPSGAGGVLGSAGSSAAGTGTQPPAAGVTGSAGSTPNAGSSAPPPAAGASAAGAAGKPPTSTGSGSGSGAPAKTCGLPGLPCCNPGNLCDVGACLRGKCTDYGGFYAVASACTTNPCGSRNAYTAGCNCPAGFNETLLWSEAKACDNGDTGTTEVHSCSAGRVPAIAYGGVWVQGPDSACAVGCKSPNPITGMCTCPDGAQQLSMTVGAVDSACPDAATTLQVCIDGEGMPLNFGGAYAVSQSAPNGCAAANPLTGLCSCPPEVTTPQSLHAGDWSIFVCNL